jgi:hypothetical protein
MKKLQYFVGKICTIITNQTARNYNDEQHANIFTGMVDEIDEMGVWVRVLPSMERKAFFPAPICGIIEEEVKIITPEQEEEIRAAYLKETVDPTPENLISIGSIRDKANKLRNGAK